MLNEEHNNLHRTYSTGYNGDWRTAYVIMEEKCWKRSFCNKGKCEDTCKSDINNVAVKKGGKYQGKFKPRRVKSGVLKSDTFKFPALLSTGENLPNTNVKNCSVSYLMFIKIILHFAMPRPCICTDMDYRIVMTYSWDILMLHRDFLGMYICWCCRYGLPLCYPSIWASAITWK